MSIIGLLVIVYSLIVGYKKPQYAISMLALIVSLSPFISKYLSANLYYLSLILIVLFLLLNVIKKKMLTLTFVIIISFSLIFLLLQVLFLKISALQIILYMLRYTAIPFVAYYSHRFLELKKVAISRVFYSYFIVNLFIVYIRVFIDYSFFGTLISYSGTIYQNFYSMGGANFRPSNLNSPIIFSIELVCFIMLLYIENAPRKETRLFVLFSVLPLLLMRSRSSYVLLVLFTLISFMKKKNYIKLISASTIGGIALYFTNIGKQVLAVITFNDDSYAVRITSVLNSINIFIFENLVTILFGFGIGYSNYELIPGEGYNIYVENFHMSLLYDMGIFVFAAWIFFNSTLIFISFSSRIKIMRQYIAIIIGILLVNIFSSNLSAYTVQIVYWIVTFRIISMMRVSSSVLDDLTSSVDEYR